MIVDATSIPMHETHSGIEVKREYSSSLACLLVLDQYCGCFQDSFGGAHTAKRWQNCDHPDITSQQIS